MKTTTKLLRMKWRISQIILETTWAALTWFLGEKTLFWVGFAAASTALVAPAHQQVFNWELWGHSEHFNWCHLDQEHQAREADEGIKALREFFVVVVVCGIVEAVANPRTNLTAQTIYKIPNSILWVTLPWILSLEHNLETSEPCITSHVSAGTQNPLFSFNSQHQQLRLQLQGHKNTSKTTLFPQQSPERGFTWRVAQRRDCRSLNWILSEVLWMWDWNRTKSHVWRGCLGSWQLQGEPGCTLNICSFQISEHRGCEEAEYRIPEWFGTLNPKWAGTPPTIPGFGHSQG